MGVQKLVTYPSMPEKGRRDSIIGTNRHWPEQLAVNKESRDKSLQILQRSYTFTMYHLGVLACDEAAYAVRF
jgi:hypothetical protein